MGLGSVASVEAHLVDRWLVHYFAQRASLGVPSLNPVMQEGRVLADRCASCRGKVRQLRTKGVPYPTWVCGGKGCGEPWPYEDRYALRGSFQLPQRPDSGELRIGTFVDLGSAIARLYDHPRHRWAMRTYCARVLGQRSHRQIAEEAAATYGRRARTVSWHRNGVALLVEEGRSAFARELRRMRLLQN